MFYRNISYFIYLYNFKGNYKQSFCCCIDIFGFWNFKVIFTEHRVCDFQQFK